MNQKPPGNKTKMVADLSTGLTFPLQILKNNVETCVITVPDAYKSLAYNSYLHHYDLESTAIR
ncbi:hypothetical protein G6549_13885 [Bacillus sp. MM2020_1]|nr:hypothetical protein [Bacillus sp. MM2020_1]